MHSHLEARWAWMLDMRRISWQREPRHMRLSRVWYDVDFFLRRSKLAIEVKSEKGPSKDDLLKMRDWITDSRCKATVLVLTRGCQVEKYLHRTDTFPTAIEKARRLTRYLCPLFFVAGNLLILERWDSFYFWLGRNQLRQCHNHFQRRSLVVTKDFLEQILDWEKKHRRSLNEHKAICRAADAGFMDNESVIELLNDSALGHDWIMKKFEKSCKASEGAYDDYDSIVKKAAAMRKESH